MERIKDLSILKMYRRGISCICVYIMFVYAYGIFSIYCICAAHPVGEWQPVYTSVWCEARGRDRNKVQLMFLYSSPQPANLTPPG